MLRICRTRKQQILWSTLALWVLATTVKAKFHLRFSRPRHHHRPRLIQRQVLHRDSNSLNQSTATKSSIDTSDDHSTGPRWNGAADPSSAACSNSGDARFHHSALTASGGASIVTDLNAALEEQTHTPMPTVTVVPAAMPQSGITKRIAETVQTSIETSVAVIMPILFAICGIRQPQNSQRLMSLSSLYVWSLIGSSVGFYLFLYFISVGYGLGIGLPILVTFVAYLRYNQHQLSTLTILHTSLVLVWSVRLVSFLLYREHINWPALHAKIVRVNRDQHAGRVWQKILCWLVYSVLYLCMVSPVWLRMEDGRSNVVQHLVPFGIGLQIVGLVVETVADCQKSRFKRDHRLSWCRQGLWKYSTHPNYAGEWLFWLGTYLAGGKSRTITERVLQISGLSFISIVLYGASNALSHKQANKYGDVYREFQATHTIFGPKIFRQPNTVSKQLVESNESRLEALEQQQHSADDGANTGVVTST